ncbi:nucleotidyl transferase AbiEii/AbiGii toxin family protein [Herbivorax sp. ANBcel31]|uniref:nucleotidyl transferase AbiEii/AbiGii toxin family protein n=1 Tax=Herbivorax sp. ANBcel31 TaxID=3069754 RepID=UPI0027B0FFD2|nr:nucleotidyl transferase AbiEii/AbiGii toxin family protein [Herbivorax sp. ANBcel31]MDQ2087913.1 nucleotidyl transferase AbiEii/AbiGii toxin family protein [Herbivorax sp. ANBcel31]
MSSKAMSLKGKIKNYAKNNNIAAQVVLQNYMFERLLQRLSVSKYSEKFVVKGGMHIAAAVIDICKIDLSDDVIFDLKSIAPIRKDDVYGGYCMRLDAIYDTIVTPLSIDISTGDIITPSVVKYKFSGIFDEDVRISLWGYNIETVMAEKIETILSRGIFTTRPRDFYDVYILGTTQKFDEKVLRAALKATAEHRGSLEKISDVNAIIEQISKSDDLKQIWRKYQKKFAYAKDVSYEGIIKILKDLTAQAV